MDRNILGIIYSFAFVFSMIFIATVIQKVFKLSNDFSRKIIHVAVGNWIFIALFYFDTWYYAIVGPVSFIILNYISYKYNIFKAMELEEKNPGTVYYSVSLTICTLFAFSKPDFLILPFLGIMAMTWGDGMAAVIGKIKPVKQIRPGKSIGGSSSFFIFTFLAVVAYFLIIGIKISTVNIIFYGLATALIGSLIELYSPKNTDNLTVPIIIGLIGFLVGV